MGVVYAIRGGGEKGVHAIFGNATLLWYEFKSTTTEAEVMIRPHFCGLGPGPRTIFTVTATCGYKIEEFSAIPEAEVLLRPLVCLRVVKATPLIIDASPAAVTQQESGFPDQVILEQVTGAEAWFRTTTGYAGSRSSFLLVICTILIALTTVGCFRSGGTWYVSAAPGDDAAATGDSAAAGRKDAATPFEDRHASEGQGQSG